MISEDKESDGAEKVDTPESGTRMPGNLFLNYKQQGNENCPLGALDTCADFIQTQSINKALQGTLHRFLQHY